MPQIGVFSARDAEKLLGTVCNQVRDLAVDREAALSGMECDLFALLEIENKNSYVKIAKVIESNKDKEIKAYHQYFFIFE